MSSDALIDAASREVVSQSVYQFADTSAAALFYTTLKARWNSCGTFVIDSQGSDAKLTVSVVAARDGGKRRAD